MRCINGRSAQSPQKNRKEEIREFRTLPKIYVQSDRHVCATCVRVLMCWCAGVGGSSPPIEYHPPPIPPSVSCSTLTPARNRPTASATKTENPKAPRAKATTRTDLQEQDGGRGRGVCQCELRKCVCVSELLRIQADHSICHVFVFILAKTHYTGPQGFRILTAHYVQ